MNCKEGGVRRLNEFGVLYELVLGIVQKLEMRKDGAQKNLVNISVGFRPWANACWLTDGQRDPSCRAEVGPSPMSQAARNPRQQRASRLQD